MVEPSHPVAQVLAATSTVASLSGIIPLFLAIPAALYYCVLLYEKVTGKNLKDLWK